ncbi:helix-turn-helix domain-containing protein [Halorubrum sp. SD683]|uniref:winged helix-turn-helix transcriptional regulator n=1 Tax=Halorubrum sp. SD683 TaxID=1855873 RepID=UPI0013023307|nr:helix-turn-helix domain-containing protein [Halorubrum sp. SD683]
MRSVDEIGQHVGDLTDPGATIEDSVLTETTVPRVVTQIAAAVEPPSVEPIWAVAAGYSRYDESDPLEHPTRQELHDTVTNVPGQSVTAIARDVGVPVSTARYHVRVLEREDLVDRHSVDGRARLYPAGFEDDPELAAALTAPAAIVDAVRTAEPVSVTGLAARTDLAPSTASYHVDRLTDAGVFERERAGKTVHVSLSAEAARRFGDTPEDG